MACGHEVHTTYLFDTLMPQWTLEDSPYHCGSRAAAYPDGSIGPGVRNHPLKRGSIFDPDPLGRLDCSGFHYGLENPSLPAEGGECDSRAACRGGCPNDNLVLTGGAEGKSVLCDVHKEILPRLRALDRR